MHAIPPAFKRLRQSASTSAKNTFPPSHKARRYVRVVEGGSCFKAPRTTTAKSIFCVLAVSPTRWGSTILPSGALHFDRG